MNADPIDPSAMVDSLVPKGGPPVSNAEGSSLSLPRRTTDLTGRRFGNLIVEKFVGVQKHKARWRVKCSCGASLVVRAAHLLSGNTTSCGCHQKQRARDCSFVDLSGRRFGRWVVTSLSRIENETTFWNVKCDCGVVRSVRATHLIQKASCSCGCLRKERVHSALFNPAISEEERIRRRTERFGNQAWSQFCREILKRDTYRCLNCSRTDRRLAVHHIFPWSTHIELRYSPANVVVLCQKCHRRFHKVYGLNCDLDDLLDFLSEEPDD